MRWGRGGSPAASPGCSCARCPLSTSVEGMRLPPCRPPGTPCPGSCQQHCRRETPTPQKKHTPGHISTGELARKTRKQNRASHLLHVWQRRPHWEEPCGEARLCGNTTGWMRPHKPCDIRYQSENTLVLILTNNRPLPQKPGEGHGFYCHVSDLTPQIGIPDSQ